MNQGQQVAGQNAVNLEIQGDGNTVQVVLPTPLDKAFDGALAAFGADRQYKILICQPSNAHPGHPWANFAAEVSAALREHGFEVMNAGAVLPREEGEPVYKADEKALHDQSCNALLVLACDYVTLSQLTHLISITCARKAQRKEIVILPDPALVNHEAYFTDGALMAAKKVGVVLEIDPAMGLNTYVEQVVRQFITSRNFYR